MLRHDERMRASMASEHHKSSLETCFFSSHFHTTGDLFMIFLHFLAILVYCKKYSKCDLIESVTLPIASF